MRRFATALAVLTLVTMNGAAATRADLTYNIVNDLADQAGYSLAGTITTDGTIGALTAADFVSWQFTITSIAHGQFETESGTQPSQAIGVTATSTLLETDGTLTLPVPFANTNVSWSPSAPYYESGYPSGAAIWYTTTPMGFPSSGDWTVATAPTSAVPEPATIWIAAIGAAGFAGHARFTRSKKQRREGQAGPSRAAE